MKKVIILLFALLVNGNSVYASECDTSGYNHFILVHGIGGSNESFASMKEVLLNDVPCTKVHEYSYETENSALNTIDFAKGLDEFVGNIGQTKSKDINIISHSQGGIVSLLWIFNSIKGTDGFTKDLARRLDMYNTLSTPFWGSDFALMGEFVFFNIGLEDNAISPFGKAQLENMKYGSKYYYDMFKMLVDPANQDVVNFMKNDVRILNIMASLPKLSGYSNYVGAQFFEGDAIVNIPSMTLDFNYAKSKSISYGIETENLIVNKFSVADKSYVTATHLALSPGVEAVAEVPETCLVPLDCTHISYLNLLNYYKNMKLDSDKSIEKKIQGFELHIIVDLPLDYDRDSLLKASILDTSGISMSNYKLGAFNQIPLSIIENKAYYLFKGSIMDEISVNAKLEIELKGKDLSSRKISIVVRKGETTFVESNLNSMTADELLLQDQVERRKKRIRRARLRGRHR